MITLKTDCDNCIHSKVCGRKDRPKYVREKLGDLIFGKGPNDDYDWDTMMEHYKVDIDISCPDFDKIVPVSRTVDVSKYVSD